MQDISNNQYDTNKDTAAEIRRHRNKLMKT